MRRRLATLTTLVVSVAFTIGAHPGVAQPNPPTSTSPAVVSSGLIADSSSAVDYWTAERMAQAQPATPSLPSGDLAGAGPGAFEPSGPPVTIDGISVDGAPSAADSPPVHPPAAIGVPPPYTTNPAKLNGVIFFSGANGALFQCSGTAVNSEDKSIVWTAGHCVHDGPGGQFHHNWVFIPGANKADPSHPFAPIQAPFGIWSARELWTVPAWAANGDLRQDFGAAVVNRVNNRRLVDSIGGQGITFNRSRDQFWSSFGYPAAPPFPFPSLQFRCDSGRALDDPFTSGATIGIFCNLTGGASGGAWLINIAPTGIGDVDGVNSYLRPIFPHIMFGPYQGNAALALFNAVRNRPA